MAVKIIKEGQIQEDNLPLVIGYFGCIHVMHLQLLTQYNDFNVLTFTTLSSKIDHQIYNYRCRMENLQRYSPHNIYVLDVENQNMKAADFVQKILKKINPSVIVCGEDFRFGSDSLGVSELSKSFKVVKFTHNDQVSTSKIYNLLKKGDIELANDYMAFPLYFKGKWVIGNKVGRKLGYPTINLINERPFILQEGSYVTRVHLGKKVYNSATFVGNSKTIANDKQIVETHVLNKRILPRNFYTSKVTNNIVVEFFKFIRPNKKCSSVDALKTEINKDLELANKYFKEQVK